MLSSIKKPNEKITCGKIEITTPNFIVENDVTIVDVKANLIAVLGVLHTLNSHSIQLPVALSSGMYFVKYGEDVFKLVVESH